MRFKSDRRIALFLPSLHGGGAERVMLNLARGFAERGFKVDLVMARAEGPYLSQLIPSVRVVDLGASRVLTSLPGLVRYLRRERPKALLSALEHANVVALWASKFAVRSTRVVVTVHSTLSRATANAQDLKNQLIPYLLRRFYPWADAIVTVSKGVAEDLQLLVPASRQKIRVIYNPIVTPELLTAGQEPLEHPWFAPGEPPVILGVGRLTQAKDYPTLIKAFALVRRERPARLVILGEGEERPKLEAVVRELGLEQDVALPGFVENPYKYMKKAGVFVLSSQWEGLPTVLIEALALGTPVISTDCKSGPAEILERGLWGRLVPVGDTCQMAGAIYEALQDNRGKGVGRAMAFSLDVITERYIKLLGME